MTRSKVQQTLEVPELSTDDLLSAFLTKASHGADFLDPERMGLPAEITSRKQMREMIESKLKFLKDGVKKDIRIADKPLQLVWDVFARKVNFAVLWKSRGGGGSLTAAIIIFVEMIYHHRSFNDLAGSGAQAKNVYEYVKYFFLKCILNPHEVLSGEPLKSLTKMVNEVYLSCMATSETQARGPHSSGLILDEACQRDKSKGPVFEAALNTVLSEEDPLIIVLSTFHAVEEFFSNIWDNAKDRGFARYFWNIWDIMEKCTDKMNCDFCPLTNITEVKDKKGKTKDFVRTGCAGKARHGTGFLSKKNAVMAKKINSSDTWNCEYEGNRPRTRGLVYPTFEDCIVPRVEVIHGARTSVGIDWGKVGQTAVIPAQRLENHVGVPNEAFFTGRPTGEIINYLRKLEVLFGELVIYADASHPFNNLDVKNAGFTIEEVAFNKWKNFGIENALKYIETGRVIVSAECKELIRQMKKYRKDESGKPIKKEDHGADSFMLSLLHFLFLNEFDILEDGEVVNYDPHKDEVIVV